MLELQIILKTKISFTLQTIEKKIGLFLKHQTEETHTERQTIQEQN